jgi:hypothetical protein
MWFGRLLLTARKRLRYKGQRFMVSYTSFGLSLRSSGLILGLLLSVPPAGFEGE